MTFVKYDKPYVRDIGVLETEQCQETLGSHNFDGAQLGPLSKDR